MGGIDCLCDGVTTKTCVSGRRLLRPGRPLFEQAWGFSIQEEFQDRGYLDRHRTNAADTDNVVKYSPPERVWILDHPGMCLVAAEARLVMDATCSLVSPNIVGGLLRDQGKSS